MIGLLFMGHKNFFFGGYCSMVKKIRFFICINFVFLIISSIGWSKNIRPMYLQGVQKLGGTQIFASFAGYSIFESRPTYFNQCPAGAGPGTCPDYVEFFNAHVGRPMGCYSGPFNGNDPPSPGCTPYTSQEPWPEANWPGQ
jgi:hypothetical protein